MKKNTILHFLEKHRFVKWLSFIAAIIGSIYLITSVPSKIYDGYKIIFEEKLLRDVEYEKISKLSIASSLEYINSIFKSPKSIQICSKASDDEDFLFTPCIFPEIAKTKYTYEFKDYFLQVLTDQNNEVFSYSILARNSTFNPEFKLYLGRFIGYKNLILRKSLFNEFDNLDDGYMKIINDSSVGNQYGGYLKFLFSDDYSVDYNILLETSYPPSWYKSFNGYNCDFNLVNGYQYVDNIYTELNTNDYEENIQKFEKTCAVETITIINSMKLLEKYRNFTYAEILDIYKSQLTFIDIP